MTADAIASTVSQSDIGGSGLGRQALNSLMHYLVDKDGMIYSLMQDFYVARHAVGLDQIAIGIGNQADALLIRFLKRKYDIIWLIGASEAANFQGHAAVGGNRRPLRRAGVRSGRAVYGSPAGRTGRTAPAQGALIYVSGSAA